MEISEVNDMEVVRASGEGTYSEAKFVFNVVETKEIARDGVSYGLVVGYASTYGNVDRVRDRVMPGAFAQSIQAYKESGRRIRMYYQHDAKEIIGGFPAELIIEDSNGLMVTGEINLEVQRGREVYALAKQGVLTDFSIGYSVKEFTLNQGIRELNQVDLWEISVVAEPANPNAKIVQVKTDPSLEETEIKNIMKSKLDVEQYLIESGLSCTAAAYVASLIDDTKFFMDPIEEDNQEQPNAVDESKELTDVLVNLKSLVEQI